MNYQIFNTPDEVVTSLAESMAEMSQKGHPVHISLSGGSTPKLLFRTLAEAPYNESVMWENLHFWWGDERCVAPDNSESNFGEANALLFRHISIPAANIHRILGEMDPQSEAKRFAQEMTEKVPSENGLPQFDWIILGMGTDGHTASLFPGQTNYEEPEIAIVAPHPQSGQLRVSKSAALISNARRITYLVLGESKAQVLKEIQQTDPQDLPYPAARIHSTNGQTEWFLDKQAAGKLTQGE